MVAREIECPKCETIITYDGVFGQCAQCGTQAGHEIRDTIIFDKPDSAEEA